MSWWVWAIIIFFVIGFIGNAMQKDENKARSKKNSSSANEKSAKEIAADITTLARLRALEKKLETAEDKLSSHSGTEKSYDKLCDKIDVLQDALQIAYNKILRWQFIPNHDIDTPLQTLEKAYKTFSLSEYAEISSTLGKKEDWYELRGEDEPDEKEPDLPFLIKFRKIVENEELSQEEKAKKINSLANRNKEFAEDYFDLNTSEKPAEQWFNEST